MSRQIKTLMLCAAMVVLVACNNRNVANNTDDIVTSNQLEGSTSEELIKDSSDPMGKDSIDTTMLSMSFDYMSREEYVMIVKGTLRYYRDHDSITLDSAIEIFSTEMPKDSIEKWWIQR